MQPQDEVPFGRLSAELVVRSARQPPLQGLPIDVENEDLVEQIDEAMEIPRAAAKEGDRMALVGHMGPDLFDIPDMVRLHKGQIPVALPLRGIQRRARLGIALVSQFAVAMDDMIAAPLQFGGDGGLAGPRDALDQVVPDAHSASLRRTTGSLAGNSSSADLRW